MVARNALFAFLLLMLLPATQAISILSYYTNATVQSDGSLRVHEVITFDLEKAYNEGFRSIRPQDFGALSDITVNSAMVNGQAVPYDVNLNGRNAEIVWERTYAGTNVVELDYTIKDRVQLYDDFAKICFEHYGANWQVPAGVFSSRMTLPPGAAGKTMHFEVYSAKKGSAHVDNLSIVIEMNDVPPGNYIGGCYLFDKSAVQTTNVVNGSAYAILKNEREIYGSETVLAPQNPNLECCCLPLFLLSAVAAAALFLNERKRPKLPESILPPGKDEPAIVSALVRNNYETRELVAATIVDLINRGVIDIVELEKKGEVGAIIKRERTILMLRKRPVILRDYENSVLNLIFADGNEVDLDAKMLEYDNVRSKGDAQDLPVVKAMKKFESEFPAQVKALFKDSEISGLSEAGKGKSGSVVGWAFMLFFAAMFIACFFVSDFLSMFDIGWYVQHGEWLRLAAVLVSAIGLLVCIPYAYIAYTRPAVPKSGANRALYGKWDAFYRGLKSSRIKEYPPASAVIWGDILVYATALGLASKVGSHLSELSSLDPRIAQRVRTMDSVAVSSMAYYGSVRGLHNLATYGNRAGAVASSGHGGFSSHSSGGWSSGGGGGFSGGSSGGGGFR